MTETSTWSLRLKHLKRRVNYTCSSCRLNFSIQSVDLISQPGGSMYWARSLLRITVINVKNFVLTHVGMIAIKMPFRLFPFVFERSRIGGLNYASFITSTVHSTSIPLTSSYLLELSRQNINSTLITTPGWLTKKKVLTDGEQMGRKKRWELSIRWDLVEVLWWSRSSEIAQLILRVH